MKSASARAALAAFTGIAHGDRQYGVHDLLLERGVLPEAAHVFAERDPERRARDLIRATIKKMCHRRPGRQRLRRVAHRRPGLFLKYLRRLLQFHSPPHFLVFAAFRRVVRRM